MHRGAPENVRVLGHDSLDLDVARPYTCPRSKWGKFRLVGRADRRRGHGQQSLDKVALASDSFVFTSSFSINQSTPKTLAQLTMHSTLILPASFAFLAALVAADPTAIDAHFAGLQRRQALGNLFGGNTGAGGGGASTFLQPVQAFLTFVKYLEQDFSAGTSPTSILL